MQSLHKLQCTAHVWHTAELGVLHLYALFKILVNTDLVLQPWEEGEQIFRCLALH